MEATVTVADILYRAADRVQFLGWTQGVGARDKHDNRVKVRTRATKWCMAGAVGEEAFAATDDNPELSQSLIIDALTAISAVLPHEYTPTHWNDRPGRTADEVADMLRRAAKGWEDR